MVTGFFLPEVPSPPVLVTPTWTAGAMATSAFVALSVGDHAVFGGIYAVAANESAYRGGLIGGFSIFCVVALVFTCFCYKTFGGALQPISLNNIGRDAKLEIMPGWAWLFVVANLALTVRALLTIPAFARPLINFGAQALESRTGTSLSVPATLESEL